MKNIKQFPCYYPRDAKRIVKVNTWWLREEAAEAFESMRNAYQALFPEHKFLITSAGRTHDQQIALYKQKPGLAAKPGNSFHEAGAACDLAVTFIKAQSGWTQEQLEEFCAKYDFYRTVQREPWHFQHKPEKGYGSVKTAISYIGNN
jgi:hypothetical protein